VRARHKQPYRAPDAPAFFGPKAPEYVDELLSEEGIRRSGLFDPAAVSGLVRRARAGRVTGFGENQAFVGILSAQLWHHAFFQSTPAVPSHAFAHAGAPRVEATPAAAGAATS
jgi:asparagine synthase (glutamine-hydrolysing)